MAEGPSNRAIVNIRNNRANRLGTYFSRIPLVELIAFPPAMTQAQLQEIPKVTITKEHADSLIQCAVCFDEFELNEDEVRKLPCNHMYHDQCIFPWLETNPSCPACRAPLPNINDDNDVLEEIIRQHYDRLTTALFRHVDVSQWQLPSLSITANADNWPIIQPGVRHVPRRAAALRASRAIQQMYRQS